MFYVRRGAPQASCLLVRLALGTPLTPHDNKRAPSTTQSHPPKSAQKMPKDAKIFSPFWHFNGPLAKVDS